MTLKLENILKDIFIKLGYNIEYAKISESKMKNLCDYQVNSSFYLAKELKKAPIEIANTIIEELKKYDDFDEVSFLNGFINLKLSDKFINDNIKNLEQTDYGIKKENKTTIVDYGGPNIAKPLHVGHLRPAIIGESIKRIFKRVGHYTIGDTHLGDYGLQIGQVIYGLQRENIKIEDIQLKDLDRIYPEMSKLCKEDENVHEKCKKITLDLQNNNEEYQMYWKKICEVSLDDIKCLYKYLDVDFELWNGESDEFPYISEVTKLLEENHLLEDDNGTKIIKIQNESDEKEMPPLIYQKNDGAYLYSTTDLATIYQRMKDYNPDNIIYVVDLRQSLHFEQVFRVCNLIELSKHTHLEHDGFGTVNGLDGKPFKTRDGSLLKLQDLISQIEELFINKKEENKNMSAEDIRILTNAIIKYADLQNNREKNYIFDINKFADVNGKTGPYILYTALRIKKIIDSNDYTNLIGDKIYNDYDRNLRMQLLQYNEFIHRAVDTKMPSFIAEYLYNLCSLTNAFYQNNNISILEDKINKNDWLFILDLTYKIIKDALGLLAIEIPSEM